MVWAHLFFFCIFSKNKVPQKLWWLVTRLSVSLTCRGRSWHYLRVNLGQRRRKEMDAEKCSLGMRRNLGRPGEVGLKLVGLQGNILEDITPSHTQVMQHSLCTYLSVPALWVTLTSQRREKQIDRKSWSWICLIIRATNKTGIPNKDTDEAIIGS